MSISIIEDKPKLVLGAEKWQAAPFRFLDNLQVFNASSIVPEGYKELIGVQMNNNCYYQITGFKLRGSDTIKFSYEYSGTACNVLGCYTNTSAQDNYSLYIGNSSSAKYLRYNGGTYSSYSIADKRYDVIWTPTGTQGMETDSTWEEKDFETSVDLCVGITGASATSAKLIGKLYGHIIDVGRLCLIPLERQLDSEIVYYDTFSNNFYEPIGETPISLGYK